ncbi:MULTISPECIES: hypothetical protein [Eggerthella]|jgi:hypothetical protein|nr:MULTISPECIES: hypothetical protein [Eggerthella]MBU5399846.1 hypothetical protein [Eggerthella lenta]MBU9892161.1 hypothetical protein [Eggerthella lenta]MBV4056579.1 hypothetical protein [Eggerthella lenta]MBV4104067.1 hypothetical protein [Eggerthella lenta]MBV4141621.1 hypothetical protein [Eggerthella lenta]
MEPESTVSIPIARLHEALPTHKRGAHASSAGTRISGLAENHSSGTACRHEALGKRTPALGALADAMAGRPIFTAASMARAIGRSMPTANTVIERFAEAGIVRQINIGKRNRAFEAQGIIEAFIGFERAAASPANDTLVSKPVRPVPFKEVR